MRKVAIVYSDVLIHHIIFRLYLYFLNIVPVLTFSIDVVFILFISMITPLLTDDEVTVFGSEVLWQKVQAKT